MIFIIVWLVCGFIGAGLAHAYFSRKWVCIEEKGTDSLIMGLFAGPIFLICSLFLSGFMKYGWKTPLSKLTAAEWDKYSDSWDKKYRTHTRPTE